MTSEALAQGLPAGESLNEGHRFFDPSAPEQPEQVFGLDTQAILDLGRAATALGALPPRINLGLYALPDAVRLVPLAEEIRSGITLSPEDIRPYRKPIKKLSPGVNFADRLTAGASVVGVGIPLRRALNNKIEREFPDRAGKAIDSAREAIAGIEQDVDYLAGFENPKEQFASEINQLAETVTGSITAQRDRRVRSGEGDRSYYSVSDPIAPKGMLGLFTKAVRKVRDFFGLFGHRKRKVNAEITAYDAGEGMAQVLRSLVSDKEQAENRFPLLSKTVLSRIPDEVKLKGDRLALVAPEALNFVFSAAADRTDHHRLIESVKRYPHELRFVTRFKKHYGRYYLEGVQRASRTLMPAIHDVLPSDGRQVKETYDKVQDFLQANRSQMELRARQDEEGPEDRRAGQMKERPKPKGLAGRFKALFSKNKR